MSLAAGFLLMAMQVGPNPTPLELEPLPMTKAERERLIGGVSTPTPAPIATAEGRTIAGNMAIIEGEYESAVALLSEAQQLALAEGKPHMAAEIGLDRARALMMLQRYSDADEALEAARSRLAGNPQAWVVSSVNARRMGDLPKASYLISEAQRFAPSDPGVLLEVGTVAYLSGDREGAIAAWQTIIDDAPASDEAEFAAQYTASAELEEQSGNPTP